MRAVVVLRYGEDMSEAGVAEALGISQPRSRARFPAS
jgi:DNA-directed RNA polymerase specialized sigma subunit